MSGNTYDFSIADTIRSVKSPDNDFAFTDGYNKLKKIGCRLAVDSLHKMGFFSVKGNIGVDALREKLGILPMYTRMFEAILSLLSEEGIVELEADNVHITGSYVPYPEGEYRDDMDALQKEYPEIMPYSNLIDRCVKAYPEVLTGKKGYTEVMFSDNTVSQSVYSGSGEVDYYNSIVAQLIYDYIAVNKGRGDTIRLLEIGAGTGGTSKSVLEKISRFVDDKEDIRYCYTDISKYFTLFGRKTFYDRYPILDFGLLDINGSPADQGFELGQYDIIFATNVIHATRDIANSISNARSLLKKNGIIIINELINKNDIATMTFGLTDGWWSYTDDIRIRNTPLLTAESWKKVMSDSGYNEVIVHPDSSNSRQGIIVGVNGSLSRSSASEAENTWNSKNSKKELIKYLRKVFSEVLKVQEEDIKNDLTFENYGIDSLISVEIQKRLSERFDGLSSTLLFEYNTIEKLADHLGTAYSGKPASVAEADTTEAEDDFSLFFVNDKTTDDDDTDESFFTSGEDVSDAINDDTLYEAEEKAVSFHTDNDIAIISVEGRYPDANELSELWENIRSGRCSVTTVPGDRWDTEGFISENYKAEKKSYTAAGAFINDIDCFDNKLFRIAPKDAEYMDPQERLFLECTWKLFEKAGYTGAHFKDIHNKVGVFAGVMSCDYSKLGAQPSYWSLTNRVSYFYDFCGPSITVDTACSSGLTAVHLACQSLRLGECKMAVAGGVNIIIHPEHYNNLCSMDMLSRSGKIHAFGEGADGFVDGEGVGALLLKPLRDAIADNDHIYGIIKGSAINAGGKTSGYTVPNPNAQADVIKTAIDNAGVDAETINYIEAHGTGTALGDPIEIRGLDNAFRNYTDKKQFCAIGSVKSNVGHLESASGILSITKILLQMQNGTLCPSINAETINPKISFEDTAFYLQREAAEWKHITKEEGGRKVVLPYRAGVSSFGAGGANAHIVLEEYPDNKDVLPDESNAEKVFVISARTKEQLRCYANAVYEYLSAYGSGDSLEEINDKVLSVVSDILYIDKNEIDTDSDFETMGFGRYQFNTLLEKLRDSYDITSDPDMLIKNNTVASLASYIYGLCGGSKAECTAAQIAYTMQCGRNAMEERAAIIYTGISDLTSKLGSWLNGSEDSIISKNNISSDIRESFRENGYDTDYLDDMLRSGNMSRAAGFWVLGADLDWRLLYGRRYTVAPLPSYPFEKRRCWISGNTVSIQPSHSVTVTASAERKQQYIPDNGTELNSAVSMEIVNNSIAVVRMHDTKNRNMFTRELVDGMKLAFEKINSSNEIKAAIITGYDNIFCTGGTFDELIDMSDKKGQFTDASFIYNAFLECRVPVISAMQGHAFGGGFVFGLYGDMIILNSGSIYNANFMKYGFTPGLGATFILKEKLGQSLANEMMFTARDYLGSELKERGASLIFETDGKILETALSIAEMISKKPMTSIEVLKKELSGRSLDAVNNIVKNEADMHSITFGLPEVKEKITYYKDIYSNNKKSTTPEDSTGVIPKETALRSSSIKAAPEVSCEKAPDRIPCGEIKEKVTEIVAAKLHYAPDEINPDFAFSDLGADSISCVEIIRDINTKFNLDLEAADLYNYPTVNKLTAHIGEIYGSSDRVKDKADNNIAETVKKDDNDSSDGRITLKPVDSENDEDAAEQDGLITLSSLDDEAVDKGTQDDYVLSLMDRLSKGEICVDDVESILSTDKD